MMLPALSPTELFYLVQTLSSIPCRILRSLTLDVKRQKPSVLKVLRYMEIASYQRSIYGKWLIDRRAQVNTKVSDPEWVEFY